ncbi:hypothetical protein K2173_018052 [Erythroxylum novogranatense]|uniref:Small subunit processome component 20 homolog n=1 Tax=Erythroxylum novogranatense TaxID=1862640 RepID=A0AAV8TUC1_9ROSI|nr:hypothetical protein K2173_018052 [Erythroxylum novogranatense]
MATLSDARAVKSLNKSSGGRRFVFKTLSQRIEEIEIDVYRSLEKIKIEPSEGSTFFRDCLMEWRELNTAEDFISFYEEMMPFVQTLPLVFLHKETIFSKLLCRLQMVARLSLEPILRLMAALSRDLLEDFLSFLPRFADSLVSLLKSGADREPEIIEQIFTSWSHMLMHLQKYLIRDIVYVLKVTTKLRYYPKSYVIEIMAAATSFLLRNAPKEQHRKGIRKIILEVVKKPVPQRKSGVSSLLYHVTRGTSSRFHSKAESILWLLTDNSTFAIGDKFEQGADTVIEVMSSTFERLCEEIEQKELVLMWNCLYQRIDGCVNNCYLLHLSRLLSLFLSALRSNYRHTMVDYQPMIDCVGSIIKKFIVSTSVSDGKEHLPEVIDTVLMLMLCILDGLNHLRDISAISHCSLQWAPVFHLRNPRCLTFIRELLKKDVQVLYEFRFNVLSVLNDLMETSQEDVVFLLLSLCERLQKEALGTSFFNGTSEDLLNIRSFLQRTICSWIEIINSNVHDDTISSLVDEANVAQLWAVICCYPHIMNIQEKSYLMRDLIDAIDRLLITESVNIAAISRHAWQSLVGAALCSFCKYGNKSGIQETVNVLHLAEKHKTSRHVLSAIADYLDYTYGPVLEPDGRHKLYPPEFEARNVADAIETFAGNLCNIDKEIRVSTLRILCHYEPQACIMSTEDEPSEKKMKTEVPNSSDVCGNGGDVLQLLLLIESTPLSVSTSRKVILLISRVQMALSTGRIPIAYIPLVLNGMIGIFYNRFNCLWDPASECLAVLVDNYTRVVWDKFINYVEQLISVFLTSHDEDSGEIAGLVEKSNELIRHFNSFLAPEFDSTPNSTVISSLLQSLQKLSSSAESHSRQIVPLFLKFLGYNNDNLVSVSTFSSDACKGKEWKGILKDWLDLLKLMRNPKAFYRSQFLKDVLSSRLIEENDAEIQMKVLDCLLTWKDDFLVPYEQHLRNLISSKQLREELVTWGLSRESGLIQEDHRVNLLPLVIRILMPKVRKLKTLASRKHTSLHHRKAVLRFIAQLDVNEMALFFVLLTKPVHSGSSRTNGTIMFSSTSPHGFISEYSPSTVLKDLTLENTTILSYKKKFGFLHVVEEILGVFDESLVKPFLDLLMGCVVQILESCSSSLHVAKAAGTSTVQSVTSTNLELHEEENSAENHMLANTSFQQLKDMRSLCLKIVCLVLNNYDNHNFGCQFWDMFFTSVKPLVDSFKNEGSSSERPSSLFSCFLAMSKSHYLLPLLNREKNLVSDVFSILTVKTASEAIISCVLEFIENLLNLDEDLEDGDSVVKGVLLPNLDELVQSLHSLFQGDNAKKRKLTKYLEDKHISIFKLLLKYVTDQLLAKKILDVLLPLLTNSKNFGFHIEILEVIRDLIPISGNDFSAKILKTVSPLLVSAELDMRLCICDLLDTLAKIDPSILLVANIVRNLNATSAAELGGLDYDAVVKAYESIGAGFFRSVPEDHALVVLSHCIYDMSSEELILRNSAYRSLLSFVDFSALTLGAELKNHCGMDGEMIASTEGCWTRVGIQQMVKKFLLKHLGNAMNAGSSVRKEWVELLREMVLKLPGVSDLNSLGALCSEDVEQDFFNNITHLQKHRRARALARFSNVIGKSNMSEAIINKIFVPLFFNMLLDVEDGKGEHVKNACLDALASISACMKWESYYALLIRCFREMSLNLKKQKILLRLICAILDHFHFLGTCSTQDFEEGTDSSFSTTSQKTASSDTVTEVQACLRKTVFPKVQKLLGSDSDKVNVNISVAALKVLKLLPADMMDSQLPSIIHRIANHLKSRMESSRDEARLALTACLKELGLEYLQFVVGVLRATLKRGYELHVLGYTLNFLLSKFLTVPICGRLDYCLKDLVSVVENDILGDVSEEKDVEKIASKMKETRKRKSFETLKLIAQSITFRSNALELLSPITAHIQKHLTAKLKIKLESMLHHIALGLECNPSVDQTDLFIFVYGLIEDGINEDNSQGISSVVERSGHTQIQDAKPISSSRAVGGRPVCSHLITVFALGLFHNHIKKVKLDKNNEHLLTMLDPFVKLLGSCLSSKYEDILSASIKCLAPLVRLPLPSLASQADKIKVTLLDVAQTSPNANSLLVQSCLRLLTVLLRSTRVTLSSDQLHFLIRSPLFFDRESCSSSVALSLLKAIVSRKLVVPEIYDIILQVADLMVKGGEDSLGKKCSQILIQFLLDYHLSGNYLQQLLDFLLSNLSYEHPTGRKAVLETLKDIITKFPKSFLDKHALPLFMNLVICLVNDNDNEIRSMAAKAIKLLTGRASPHLLDTILELSLSWYMSAKHQQQTPGAQALGLLVDVISTRFQDHISSILPLNRNILLSAVNAVTDRQSADFSGEGVPRWKEAYYSLVLLEKILHCFGDLFFTRELEDIYVTICEFLAHPHPWLRNISSRLVASYFTATTKVRRENNENSIVTFSLMRPSKLFMVAVSHCYQLKAHDIDEASSNLIVENLVFAICAIHTLMGRAGHVHSHKFWSALEQQDQYQFLKAFQLLDSGKAKGLFQYIISDVHEHNDREQYENLRYFFVSNLLKSMGKIALQREAIQMKIVFDCIRKISAQINQEDCRQYAVDMLLPLYKVCEGFSGKLISDELKQLAQEVCESIRKTLGIQEFVQVYSEIRKSLKRKREKRRQEEKVMAVVNPTRNAKRKLRIAAKHRAHKKRKIMSMKLGRWMH